MSKLISNMANNALAKYLKTLGLSSASRVLTDSPQLHFTIPIWPFAAICVQHDTILNTKRIVRLTADPVEARYRLLGCRPLPDVALGAVTVRVEVRPSRVWYRIYDIPTTYANQTEIAGQHNTLQVHVQVTSTAVKDSYRVRLFGPSFNKQRAF